MIRIRYIGEQLIARAFDHTFDRKRWDRKHELEAGEIATPTANPRFKVDAPPIGEPSSGLTDGRTAG